MSRALPPWHLWGVSQTFSLTNTGNASQQLVKVTARFPMTWAFTLWARVLNASGTAATQAQAQFEFITGVGRSTADIPFFSILVPQLAGAASASPGAFAWTNATEPIGAAILSVGPPVAIAPFIDKFVAQDIQIKATASISGGDGTTLLALEVGAQVAPLTHVRPEWFTQEFSGNEKFGT